MLIATDYSRVAMKTTQFKYQDLMMPFVIRNIGSQNKTRSRVHIF